MIAVDAPVNGHKVGDLVTIGRGKVVWRVESFGRFTEDGMTFASLAAVEGYANTTAPAGRLNAAQVAP